MSCAARSQRRGTQHGGSLSLACDREVRCRGSGGWKLTQEVDYRAALRLRPEGRLDPEAQLLERRQGPMPELVVSQRGEEGGSARELGQLHRRDGPASARLLPGLGGMDDLARARDSLDTHELDPLHMSHDGRSHLQGRAYSSRNDGQGGRRPG